MELTILSNLMHYFCFIYDKVYSNSLTLEEISRNIKNSPIYTYNADSKFE